MSVDAPLAARTIKGQANWADPSKQSSCRACRHFVLKHEADAKELFKVVDGNCARYASLRKAQKIKPHTVYIPSNATACRDFERA